MCAVELSAREIGRLRRAADNETPMTNRGHHESVLGGLPSRPRSALGVSVHDGILRAVGAAHCERDPTCRCRGKRERIREQCGDVFRVRRVRQLVGFGDSFGVVEARRCAVACEGEEECPSCRHP